MAQTKDSPARLTKADGMSHRLYSKAELIAVLGEPSFEGNSPRPIFDEQRGVGHVFGSPVVKNAPPPRRNEFRWMEWD
jgi:hypothetical protein